jgi:molybdenum cofactor cytidylyltransferase
MPGALVLAAGLSRRMGRFKLTLPWGEPGEARTVIGQVVATLEAAGLREIIVVTGHRAEEVVAALTGTSAQCVFNPDYASGEMLTSVQVGLSTLSDHGVAALLCLGDQPQMEGTAVQAIVAAGQAAGWQTIVVPSFQMRAGHPILLPRWLWPDILVCQGTLRAVLAAHRGQTEYLVVQTPAVLADLDTPEDYAASSVKRDASNVMRRSSHMERTDHATFACRTTSFRPQ